MQMTKEEERVIAYWQNVRYRRRLPNAMFHASDDNPLCGDELSFDVSINGGIITEIAFSGEACTLTIATAAMMAERLDGKNAIDFKCIDPLQLIGVPVNTNRKECVLLPWRVLRKCISSSGLTV